MLSSRGGFLTYPMYHHGGTIKYINKLWWNKENGSQLTDSEELKKNPDWATVGPAKYTDHQALTHRWKWYAIVVMESEVDPSWISCNNFLFVLFSIKNEIIITSIKHKLQSKNSKRVWSGNTTITNRRQPPGTARKSRSTITRHQEDKLSKAISSLFPIKMIAILEWT